MERTRLRRRLDTTIPVCAGLFLALLVLAHFNLMHGLDSYVMPLTPAPSASAAVAGDLRAVTPNLVEQRIDEAVEACPLMSLRLDSSAPLLPFALLVSVLLVLGFTLARPVPRLACLPLPCGPARQAILQRFTL